MEFQDKTATTVTSNVTNIAPTDTKTESADVTELEKLRQKYKKQDDKIYEVITTLQEDDETEVQLNYIFRKPGTASYDRYVKTASTSSSKALRTFVSDNIIEEQKESLTKNMEEYPALAISIGEKLLYMLGLSKDTTVKKL